MSNTTILGIKLNSRMETAIPFQEVLSEHGCIIKGRFGLHNVENGKCSPSGIVLLELIGTEQERSKLENDLTSLKNIEIQKMTF